MRKMLCGLLALLALLPGCGKGTEAAAEQLLQPYQNMESAEMEAEVKCEYSDELREYKLSCSYVPEGKSKVKVLEPEAIAGLTAVFDGDGASLCYEDLCLDAGTLGEEELSPAEVLPLLFDAVRSGYLLEESRESYRGEDAYRFCFETRGETEKIYYTFYISPEGYPIAAEVSTGNVLNFRLAFTSFSFGAILVPEGK